MVKVGFAVAVAVARTALTVHKVEQQHVPLRDVLQQLLRPSAITPTPEPHLRVDHLRLRRLLVLLPSRTVRQSVRQK